MIASSKYNLKCHKEIKPNKSRKNLSRPAGGTVWDPIHRLGGAHPPGLALLQGGALSLHGVVDDTAGSPREVHGNQRVLRYAPLLAGGRGGGWGGWGLTRVRGQTSQTQSVERDKSCLHTDPVKSIHQRSSEEKHEPPTVLLLSHADRRKHDFQMRL